MKSSCVTSTAPPSGNWLDEFTPQLWITAKLIKWTGCFCLFFRLLFVCFLHKQHHSYIIKLKTPTKSIPTFHHLNASQLPAWAGAKVCPQTTSPPHQAHQIKCPLRGISKRRQFERGRPFKKLQRDRARTKQTNHVSSVRGLWLVRGVDPLHQSRCPLAFTTAAHWERERRRWKKMERAAEFTAASPSSPKQHQTKKQQLINRRVKEAEAKRSQQTLQHVISQPHHFRSEAPRLPSDLNQTSLRAPHCIINFPSRRWDHDNLVSHLGGKWDLPSNQATIQFD